VNLRKRWVLGTWFAFVVACIAVITRTDFTTDLSAFLPRSPTPAQQILVEQLRSGAVSRLILVGIEGGAAAALAQASRALAASLRGRNEFVLIANGEDAVSDKDRDFLWRNRYLLSPAVTPERFSAQGLRERLEANLQLLGSPAGMFVRRMLPSDPSGELMVLIERLQGETRPGTQHGVSFSQDGKRALLVAQTRAAGGDIDAQERALRVIRSAFAEASGDSALNLLLTGPGVFSVQSRERIKHDVSRFAVIGTALVAALLLALYRSPRLLGLALLPVASGVLAGVAAVSVGFGTVHGITLGFGVTLLGEGVDYAIYLFTQSAPGRQPEQTLDRIWPTLRLGVLTSICGFSAMLFSGFTGLAQLGLFSIVGLIVAVIVTRAMLPALLPPGFTVSAVTTLAPSVMTLVRRAPLLRVPMLMAIVLAAAYLVLRGGPLWSDDLARLSPVPASDQSLDQQLRRDVGAPDVRYVIVVHANDEQSALQASEAIASALERSIRHGWLAGYETPSTYLPSRRAQRERQAALPSPETLRENLRQALQGLSFRTGLFEPFVRDAAAARDLPLLDRQSLQGTHLALRLDSLLTKRENGWAALVPLRGVTHADNVVREIGVVPQAQVVLLDVKRESEVLYRTYRREVLNYSLLGACAIVVLLFASLRSPRRVFDVLAPLAAAVIAVTAVLTLSGHELSIFHLVGLLLVVAVGSNYSLFFDRQMPSAQDRERTIVSLLFAAGSTTIGFGVLSFSAVPVLNAIGSTVGMGAIMALGFAAILSRRGEGGPAGGAA
jgi:predicted exporter